MSRPLSVTAVGGLRPAIRAIFALSLACSAVPALAQGIATDQQLDELVITGKKVSRKAPAVPATVVTGVLLGVLAGVLAAAAPEGMGGVSLGVLLDGGVLGVPHDVLLELIVIYCHCGAGDGG